MRGGNPNTTNRGKQGMSVHTPATTDEYYEVLKAFATQNPNGNGVADGIGVYGMAAGGYGQNVTNVLMNSFIFYNGGTQNGGLSLSEDGNTVIAPFATERWKAGLEYMNKLCQENLLPASIFTDDDTQFKATLNNEVNIVGSVSAGSHSNWTDANTNANFIDMMMIPPLKAPEGAAYSAYIYST